jgi:anti-sigma regulatory factor (Ser/Thr protein kinase)
VSSNASGAATFSITLAATLEAPSQARHFLWEFIGRQPPRNFDAAALLTTEVVSNAVRHGSPDRGDPIEVTLTTSEGLLKVTVNDRGTGYDPATVEIGDTSWGIHLVDQLASRWGVERKREGTEVWFEMDDPGERGEIGQGG